MNIQDAARLCSLPRKTIRYYEDVGLVTPGRRGNGYREFDRSDIVRLSFIARARGLGFSMEDVRGLLRLQDNPVRRSAEVKALAKSQLAKLEYKLSEISKMREELQDLFDACLGDEGASCAILDGLAQTK